jgi:hypothetical protein
MQTEGQEQEIGSFTTEGLRARARATASALRDGIARLANKGRNPFTTATDQLASMYGSLDELDSAVRTAMRDDPSPGRPDLIDLHARLGICKSAILDLAGLAPDPENPGFRKCVAYTSARVEGLFDFAEPPDEAREALVG